MDMNGHASCMVRVDAMKDQSSVRPGAEERKAEVPFRHLPSVATWLVPIKQGEQAENEMLRPPVPSVDAWLQRRPPSSTSSRRDTQGNLQDGHESEFSGDSSPGTARDVLCRSLRLCATLSHRAGPVILQRVRCPA